MVILPPLVFPGLTIALRLARYTAYLIIMILSTFVVSCKCTMVLETV